MQARLRLLRQKPEARRPTCPARTHVDLARPQDVLAPSVDHRLFSHRKPAPRIRQIPCAPRKRAAWLSDIPA